MYEKYIFSHVLQLKNNNYCSKTGRLIIIIHILKA